MNLLFQLLVVMGAVAGGGTADLHGNMAVAEMAAPDAMTPEISAAIVRVAEDQTPTGKFLTATEVKPILGATSGNWVGVREWEGNDLIYFTHLLAWRCGLYEIRYAVNGGSQQLWPVPDCDPATHTVGAIPDGAEIYATHPLNSVQTISIELLYDDLSTQTAEFERAAIKIP